MSNKTYAIGVGMTKSTSPARRRAIAPLGQRRRKLQCSELTWQLRGTADKRQVQDVRVGLQHSIGLGGTAVVSIYRKAAH